MTPTTDFWDVPAREIPGWTQIGNIHGDKFACWVQHEDGSNRAIQRADYRDDSYWLMIDRTVHGTFPTPELAAEAAAKIIEESKK